MVLLFFAFLVAGAVPAKISERLTARDRPRERAEPKRKRKKKRLASERRKEKGTKNAQRKKEKQETMHMIRRARSVAVACLVAGIAAELALAIALAVVASKHVHDPVAHQHQELVVWRLITAMFAVALGTPMALALGLVFATTKDQPGASALAAHIDHVLSATTRVEATHITGVYLERAGAAMSVLGGHTWCGRPQRDPALCHHAWRVNQWGHATACIFWFTGNGFDSLGPFGVRGCASPCVPDGTTELAWTQTYLDREDAQGSRRFSYEFRGTLAVDSTDAPVIWGAWHRPMGDGLVVRPGDIVGGEFVLVRVSTETTTPSAHLPCAGSVHPRSPLVPDATIV